MVYTCSLTPSLPPPLCSLTPQSIRPKEKVTGAQPRGRTSADPARGSPGRSSDPGGDRQLADVAFLEREAGYDGHGRGGAVL